MEYENSWKKRDMVESDTARERFKPVTREQDSFPNFRIDSLRIDGILLSLY